MIGWGDSVFCRITSAGVGGQSQISGKSAGQFQQKTGRATGGGFPDDEGIHLTITKHGGRLGGHLGDCGPMLADTGYGCRRLGVVAVEASVVRPGVSPKSGRKGASDLGVGWGGVEI